MLYIISEGFLSAYVDYGNMLMQKYIMLLLLCSSLSITFPKIKPIPHSSNALFFAIAQGNARYTTYLLNQNVSPNVQREGSENSPLMEAIIMLGEKLIEMETQILSQEIADPKNINDDFRSFLRSFIVSLIIGISASEIQNNLEKINNDVHNPLIGVLQSLSHSFLPVISRSAYIWCAYSLLDYGIASGQKNQNQSNNGSNVIEKYKKTIDVLLSNPTIDINHVNNHGETALSLVRYYKSKIKSVSLKIMLYQLERALINEGAQHYPEYYGHASAP